jgi:TolB-like protein
MVVCFMMCLQAVAPSWADQVATEADQRWARRAISQEASLQAADLPANSLSVLYFTDTTGCMELAALPKGLCFMLITDLSQVKQLLVVERTRLQALLEEMGLGRSGLVEPGTEPRIGRLLGARFLVGGEISMGTACPSPSTGSIDQVLDMGIQVSPGLLNVPDGQMQALPAVGGRVSQLFQMEKEILFALVERLGLALSEDQRRMLSRPATTDGRAMYYFFMGLMYSDLQRYRQSAGYYEKALKADPGFNWPRAALDELRQRGLYQPPRTVKPILKSIRNRTSLTDNLFQDDVVRRARTPYDVALRQRLKPKPASELDLDRDGYTPADGDCDDSQAGIYPGAPEICGDGIDQDCDGQDLACTPEPPMDADGDGFTPQDGDCDDANAGVYPGAPEIQCDGIDQDCNGSDLCPEPVDADGDGYNSDVDCNDNDATIHPGAQEICGDGIDQDCNGSDLSCGAEDADGDGYPSETDCNDNDATVYPGADEVTCDGIDQNCDGSDDCPDRDGDGFTADQDCNDDDASIYPGANEIPCDQIDQDCDGADDCPIDADGDGWSVPDDCNDNDPTVHPGAPEICSDSIDQDCDGADLPCALADRDRDGYTSFAGDCNDYDSTIYPGAPERCDGKDNDCNGYTDDNPQCEYQENELPTAME